jgi:predicted small secreted protein
MKKLLFLVVFFTSTTLFACDTPKETIKDLKKLADKIEKNYKEYTDEDWEEVAEEYAKLAKEFKEQEYTKEELKEFGRQKGRIKGFMTKKTLNKWSENIENFANELGGGIEGFFEAIETIVEE